jgi:hypothetical protein
MPIVERREREQGELFISPEGRWAVIGSSLWDMETAAKVCEVVRPAGPLRAVAVTAEGRVLAAMSRRRQSYIADLNTGEVVCGLAEETRLNHSAAFNSGGTRLIGSSMGYGDEPLGVWDAATGATLISESEFPRAVAVSSCCRFAACSHGANEIRVWDMGRPAERLVLRGHSGLVTSLAITARGEWLASGSADGTVRLWHHRRWDEVEVFGAAGAVVNAVAMTPGGRLVLSGSAGGSVRLWLRGQRFPLAEYEVGEAVTQCGISADGHGLVAGTLGGATVFMRWDAEK